MRQFLIAVTVLLAACSPKSPPLIKEVPNVFIPADEFFECPTVERFPDPQTLTDGMIAELLVTLDHYNRTCAESLEEVKRQLIAAKERLETQE